MKNLKPILLASVCLNLVLIGLMVGGAWKGHQMRPQNGPADEISAIMYSAPKAMREDLRGKFKDIASKRNRDGQNTSALSDIIGQVPFDEGKLTEFLATSRDSNTQIAQSAHAGLIASIKKLTDDERTELAKNLKDRPMRRDHDRDKSKRQ